MFIPTHPNNCICFYTVEVMIKDDERFGCVEFQIRCCHTL